ncbi:AAA family ATPase [Acidianus sulfidivorans JP7]|uniref:ATP-binding protein n=1 Tax=Acidianus sulfidivorans JP7 TaxID=619593 RepID=A0A2U9IJN2_9CREN|nr:ATP-binding protein [Acidianus sulfidivorans]AWR96195.1 AAA family ATPase [Acidianus sulfidivorans JP7]
MLVIYFDFKPKETKEDLFDREEELKKLFSSMNETIILLTGIRRIGKTSLLKVFLNESKLPYALVDVRAPLTSYRSLYSIFSDLLSQLNKKRKIVDALKYIKGISLFGINISLSWDPKSRPSISEIMDRVDESGKVIIAFDEAQNLRGKLSNDFLSVLAHCYDYCKNVTFILTGSEIGLLYDFLKIDDPSSPLYGRHVEEIRLNRFTKEKSLEFLKEGFRQANISPNEDVLEYAVSKLDGIVGWLTEFGYRCVKVGEVKREIVDEILEIASKLIIEELSHYSKDYVTVVEGIAKGYNTWSQLKKYLEEKKKRIIYDAELKRYLDKLEKRSYIIRRESGEYDLTDPILKSVLS